MNKRFILFNAIPNFERKQNKDDERNAQLGFHQCKKICIHIFLVNLVIGLMFNLIINFNTFNLYSHLTFYFKFFYSTIAIK